MTVVLRRSLRRMESQTVTEKALDTSTLESNQITPPVINKLEGVTPDQPPIIQISNHLKDKFQEMLLMLKETALQSLGLPDFQPGYT